LSHAAASPCQIFQLSIRNLPTIRFDNVKGHLQQRQQVSQANGSNQTPSFERCEQQLLPQIRLPEMDSHKVRHLVANRRILIQCSDGGGHGENQDIRLDVSPLLWPDQFSRAYLETRNESPDRREFEIQILAKISAKHGLS
jgi:hypothetical protein